MIIAGVVNSDGSVQSGTGFTSNRKKTGTYEVTFSSSFSDTPAVVVTEVDNYDSNSTRRTGYIYNLGVNGFTVTVGNDEGDDRDREFTFIAATTDFSS
jgi:hypothetical protein